MKLTFMCWLVTLQFLLLAVPSWQQLGRMSVKLLPDERHIGYVNSELVVGLPQLRFTFDPICANPQSMMIISQRMQTKAPIEWSVDMGNLEFDSKSRQYFIDSVNFTQSSVYTAFCKRHPKVDYNPQNVQIKVKPQILLVDVAENEDSDPVELERLFAGIKSTYNLQASFKHGAMLKLRFHVGNGYYGNDERGDFHLDDHGIMAENLTENRGKEKQLLLNFGESYPSGTSYRYELSLKRIVETSPWQCLFNGDLVGSTFMASDPENTQHNVTVNLQLQYRPQNVVPFVEMSHSNYCKVGCRSRSSCPSSYVARLEIHDDNLQLAFLFTWTNSNGENGRFLNESGCNYLRRLKQCGSNSYFKCVLTNAAGTTLVTQPIAIVDGIDELNITTKSTTVTVEKQLDWWEILLIAMTSVFFFLFLVLVLKPIVTRRLANHHRIIDNQSIIKVEVVPPTAIFGSDGRPVKNCIVNRHSEMAPLPPPVDVTLRPSSAPATTSIASNEGVNNRCYSSVETTLALNNRRIVDIEDQQEDVYQNVIPEMVPTGEDG